MNYYKYLTEELSRASKFYLKQFKGYKALKNKIASSRASGEDIEKFKSGSKNLDKARKLVPRDRVRQNFRRKNNLISGFDK